MKSGIYAVETRDVVCDTLKCHFLATNENIWALHHRRTENANLERPDLVRVTLAMQFCLFACLTSVLVLCLLSKKSNRAM